MHHVILLLLALVLHNQISDTHTTIEDKPLNRTWWFLKDGRAYPEHKALTSHLPIYPEESNGDRILEQLLYIPESYRTKSRKSYLIVFYAVWWKKYDPKDAFSQCPVKNCRLTFDRALSPVADAILFPADDPPLDIVRPKGQLWVFYSIESPMSPTGRYHGPYDVVNLTMTYRKDSDIVSPYGKWVYYDPKITQIPQDRNYAVGKTKQVAWFVSNCETGNERLKYAKIISRHNISVDIYRACGDLKCTKLDKSCYKMLEKHYKFYFAFENANCREYITEKFFENALGRSVVPIVMGPRLEDYVRVAPEGSFIHVEQFEDHEELAAYLLKLDGDDDLYNTYFRWKGTGEFIKDSGYDWCRLCAILNDKKERRVDDIIRWWSPDNICHLEETVPIDLEAFVSSSFSGQNDLKSFLNYSNRKRFMFIMLTYFVKMLYYCV